MNPLGRRLPTDWRHYDKFPLTAATAPTQAVPVVLGIAWYSAFDKPEKIGRRYFIGRGELGSVRGGHAICALPYGVRDPLSWWTYYQQRGGSCVGYSESRMMSLLNRRRYFADWLYRSAQETDEFTDTPPAEGTTVRAGLEILRTKGHRRVTGAHAYAPDQAEGISAYRWASVVDEILGVLERWDEDAIPLLQSWGRGYPHTVWLPLETLERLLHEDGECAIVTDK